MNNFIEQGYLNNKSKIKISGTIPLPKISENLQKWSGKCRPPESIGNISKNYLLAAQTGEIFAKLLPFFENVSLIENEYIYQPGDRIDFVYFPESGVVSEFQILEDGATIEIAMIGREGIAGLLSVFNIQRAVKWTQVSVAGNAFKLPVKILRDELNNSSSFQLLLFDYIQTYIGQITQRAVCVSHHTLEKRFCSWLLMLQSRQKTDKLPFTQEKVARLLGVHRPSVTLTAQTLRDRGLIDYMRGKIVIRNRHGLEKYACRCYSEIDKKFDNENIFL